MAETAPPRSSVRVCKQFTSWTTVFLFLIADLQWSYILADADRALHRVTEETSILHVESEHAWRNSKPAAEIFILRSVTRRRVTTSQDVNTRSRLQLQEEALTTFKAAVTSDPLGTLLSWGANDSDACAWAGVLCSRKHPKHLIALNLSNAALVGNLSSALKEVGKLPFLKSLDLSNNNFLGSIPAASLANCSNLLYLNVSHNQLSGDIPLPLGEMINLQSLDIGGNDLAGQIPLVLGNCTSLRVLDLGSNLLVGAIPPAFGRLSLLESLSLGMNSLTGSLPAALGNCSSLTRLDVGANLNLGNELPPDFSQLKSLQRFNLSGCSFEGALANSAWLGNLTALIELSLFGNQFHGRIPDWIAQLPDLSTLDLGSNNFTGEIPISITNCTALTSLKIDQNPLTGKIPPNIGFLRSLEILQLWGNDFSGFIPSSLANCSDLITLSLGPSLLLDPQIVPSWIGSFTNLFDLFLPQMNLKGAIASEIGQLSNLRRLNMYGNNLSGAIPLSLANCTSLLLLSLNKNHLTGEIPPEIGLLPSLTSISFGQNFLTGTFPAFILNLTLIEDLGLELNSLNGQIDDNFGRLSQLQSVYAGGNHFSGVIPESLSNCSRLFYLELSGNHLSGTIPPSMGNMTSLEQVYFASNLIGGEIPADLMRCSKLGYLDLSDNNLEGSIPSNIGQLSALRYLFLWKNFVTGVVPSSLGNCSDMTNLYLAENKFVGSVPGESISKMSASLTTLNLSHNLFSGSWPLQLSELTNIQFLDVSVNNISGSIPSSLGIRCIVLQWLDVSTNNLTGALPQSLGSLLDLNVFNASYNDFQGPIPESGIFKDNVTKASFLGNPGLCGVVLGPDQECLNSSAHHIAATSKSCQGFKCEHIWIPTTCALGGAVLIGAGVLYWMNKIYVSKKRINYGSEHLTLNFAAHVGYRFTEKDVLRIIHGNGENVIRVGANSTVYKGALPGGKMIAIKVLRILEDTEDVDDDRRDPESKLLQEVYTAAELHHRNILRVIGFCSTPDLKAIVLEYMPQGSLHTHLHELEKDVSALTWRQRFNIALGVAEATVYLHHDFPEPLIHRDLKPSNILLDGNFEPRVCDFGLSKFTNPLRAGEATASTFCGTFGYIPPEYATGSTVSTKGDVYSYGMVLLELLTGRPPTLRDNHDAPGTSDSQILKEWVLESFQERPLELLDPALKNEAEIQSIEKEQMMLVMRVALICTRETPQTRPSMTDVLAMLTQIKERGSLVLVNPSTVKDLAGDHNHT